MKTKYLYFILFIFFCYSLFLVANQFFFFSLSYDESLFINAALGKHPTTFIDKHWHGFPLMVMDYIGALKSWLYYPIFKIFGVNILSIRLPMVILMYFNIFLIYKIAIQFFDFNVVFLLIILIFTDYTFIYQHKIDHGPSAIETCLKLLAILFISKKDSTKNNLIILGILLLGVFNKLNFIWFVNALFGCYILSTLLFKQEQKQFSISSLFKKEVLIKSISYLIILLFFFLIIKGQGIKPKGAGYLVDLLNLIEYQFNHMVFVILNQRYEYLLGWNSDYPILFITGKAIILIIIITNIYWLFTRQNSIQKAHFQLFILTGIIALQLFITKEASNIWHVLMLYPFVQLLIISTVFTLTKKIYKTKSHLLFYIFCIIWVGFNIIAYQIFQQKIKEKCNFWLYEPTLNNLIEYVQNRPEKNIISLGAGIHSQLLVLDKKNKNFDEFIAPQAISEALLNKFNDNPEQFLIVENINSNLDNKRVHYHELKEKMKLRNLKMKHLSTLSDKCNHPQYHIFKLEKNLN